MAGITGEFRAMNSFQIQQLTRTGTGDRWDCNANLRVYRSLEGRRHSGRLNDYDMLIW